MVTVIARFKVQAGKQDEAEAELRRMAEAVEVEEPGTLTYLCHRSQQDPSEIVFFEVYAGDAAFTTHGQTPHMGALRGRFGELFDPSTFKVERLERIAGFARASQ